MTHKIIINPLPFDDVEWPLTSTLRIYTHTNDSHINNSLNRNKET